MADPTPQATRILAIGGIALAGIYLLNNLSGIASNAGLYWTLVACLLVVAAFCIVKGYLMLKTNMKQPE
jgi:hypothetical protein